MKRHVLSVFAVLCVLSLEAADNLKSKTTYAKAYGETKNPVAVDAAKDLPRYPAVEPKDAIATWQVKKGFHLELAANEPQVRSPIAVSYDEHGRMFVCEMIDYSEMRDVTPHLGRVSMLEDKDGDGHFETSTVFADDLAWPTGLIWANGGIYVIATPDIWFFKDTDGDGKADLREKVFTGFGTGLKLLNVQGLANSPMWGQDNRIHILAGGGNRGVVRRTGVPPVASASGILPDTAGKMPAAQATGKMPVPQEGVELGGKDFWFDPRTHEFGLEGGGAQYGMSFDNYGRKFGCSNSDHLQYWVYDDKYANRNPFFQMPAARQSIAVDGGAAEVFRISPDEPWRIIRTRWRIAGVVKGAVEGGGRVSGYFTGATGTTIYRGDACGPDFLNNSFSGDAGGQLVHRKIIRPTADGVSLEGERPADERGFEFAASKDTWVRVVNFANAPDGCLNIIDMYREVIEHPWSIPDEIKQHIDLNNGNDRGRIYRIVPDGWQRAQGEERRGNIAKASTEELVKLLSHPNGWHRDTAQRLIYERNDKAALDPLYTLLMGDNPIAKLHALGALSGMKSVAQAVIFDALASGQPEVAERACGMAEALISQEPLTANALVGKLVELTTTKQPNRLRFQALLSLGNIVGTGVGTNSAAIDAEILAAFVAVLKADDSSRLLLSAIGCAPPPVILRATSLLLSDIPAKGLGSLAMMIEASASMKLSQGDYQMLINGVARSPQSHGTSTIRALAAGLRKAGSSIDKADTEHKLTPVFAKATATAIDTKASESARLEAIDLIALTSSKEASDALTQCLGAGQPDAVQGAALKTLAQHSTAAVTKTLLDSWPNYGPKTKAAAMDTMFARDDRAIALLESSVIKPTDLPASQVQALVHHKSAKVAEVAKKVLASVIPPSREEVVAKFKPALSTKGDATRGQAVFMARCMACHRAGTAGLQVGPDLVTVKTKGRDGILTAILEPNKEVAAQFIAYIVNTKDGQTMTGIVTKDDASSLSLKMMAGVEQNIQRSNIKGSSSSGQSLMPEGLETGMTVQEMADLLDFIESLK